MSSVTPPPTHHTGELNGIRVLVTGATSGLGATMTAALAEAGARGRRAPASRRCHA